MTMRPLEWIRTYPEIDDAPSLRTMRRFARENMAEAKRLMRLLRKQPEDAASFKPDFDQNLEALNLIEARMRALGIEIENTPIRTHAGGTR